MTWGFAGQRFSLIEDAEAGLAFVRAYNDWLSEESRGVVPLPFRPVGHPGRLRDPETAAHEIRRNAAARFQGDAVPREPGSGSGSRASTRATGTRSGLHARRPKRS